MDLEKIRHVDGKVAGLILVVLGVAVIAAGFLFQDTKNEMDFKVLKVIKGDEAINMVKSIHIGRFEVKSATVLELEGIGKIRVWIAYADSPSTARDMVEKMKSKVHLYFSSPEDVEINSLKTYKVFGNNRVHYFFSHENQIVWIEFENPDVDYHRNVVKYLFTEGGMEKYIN